MNVNELIRDVLHEQAEEQQPLGPGFAARTLAVRRRRRTRAVVAVAAVTAAVLAVAIGVPQLDSGRDGAPVAHGTDQRDVIAHPEQSPPREMISAGHTTLAAYWKSSVVKVTADEGYAQRTYWILDQKTGRYVKDSRWSFVAVAPGMQTAAVLERHLPARRIGLLDLSTGKVGRWIDAAKGVGGVAFSRDGARLVATTYSDEPDQLRRATSGVDSDGDGDDDSGPARGPKVWVSGFGSSDRTGFYVFEVDSASGSWSAVPRRNHIEPRQDFAFSADGRLVLSRLLKEPWQEFYDVKGDKVAMPANEKHLYANFDARLSPNGRLAAGDFAGSGAGRETEIIDPYTGKQVHTVRGKHLLAWVDNKRLIGWYPASGTHTFDSRLVLVTIGSDKVVPLSGFSKRSDRWLDVAPDLWTPVFATR